MRGMMDRSGVDRGYGSRFPYGRREGPDYRGGPSRGYDHGDSYGRDYGSYDRDNYGRDYDAYGHMDDRRYYDHPPERRFPVRDRAMPYDRMRMAPPHPRTSGVPMDMYNRRRYDAYPEGRGGMNDFGRYDVDYGKPYVRGGSDRVGGSGPFRKGASVGGGSGGMGGMGGVGGVDRFHYQHRNKIFIGNLSGEITEEELTNAFTKFGAVHKIDFRRKFAFVDYVRPRDADTAIREMNGKMFLGSKLKVQPHTEQQRRINIQREPNLACQVTVLNLDPSVSWQDLKDFARQAGDVNYASVIIRGLKRYGLIEYANEKFVKIACNELSGKKIANNKLEIVPCPVNEYVRRLDQQQSAGSATANRYEMDTFEAEESYEGQEEAPINRDHSDNTKEQQIYQDGHIDSVDYDIGN